MVGFKKDKEESSESRFMKVELSNYESPMYFDYNNKEFVSWGKFNEYPFFLNNLISMHPEHGAIVKGKAAYVLGKGLKVENNEGSALEMAQGEYFLENANRYETWDELLRKSLLNFQLYNGWAWQIIWNNAKTKFECFHMEFGKLRRSKCGKFIFYCDAWMIEQNGKYRSNPNPENHSSFKKFPCFNPNIRTETSIFYFKIDDSDVTPNGHLYPKPEYESAIMEIETDIEISKLHYHHMKNGMFASQLMTLFKGEPDKKEKLAIKRMFDRTYGGTDNAGSVILYFGDKGETAPDFKPLTGNDLDKQFELVTKRCQDKIFSAHLTAPVLFGIKTEGSLSDTSGQATLKEWDKFVKTYIENRQRIVATEIENLAYIQGIDIDLRFEQTTPVGLDLPTDANILGLFDKETLTAYFAKKYGIELVNPTVPTVKSNTPQPVTQVNENLKKLSGRDWQHIKRLIREVENGKTRREVASMLLKNAYALTDADISVLFNTPQSGFNAFQKRIELDAAEDRILDMFEACAIDDNDDEVVETFVVHDGKDVRLNKFLTESETKNFLIDAFKGNPYMTPKEAARQLNIPLDEVMLILGGLVTAGLLLNVGNSFTPTEKAINKEVPTVEVETYRVYKYALNDDAPALKGGRSRLFCQRLMALSNAGKRWTREAIDKIAVSAKAEMSMPEVDIWTYRGGFYTNPNTGVTTSFCRHHWEVIVKTRKKGGSE